MKKLHDVLARHSLLLLWALSTLAAAAVAQPRFPGAPARLPNDVPRIYEPRSEKAKAATLFQFSTLPALSLGLYDGGMTFGEVLRHGDFGLGTADALDGEVVILNGKAWQMRSNGQVAAVAPEMSTPFAVVTRFAPDRRQSVAQPAEYSALRQTLDEMLLTPNVPYAISISGTFARIKVRSVPRQSKPYRRLAEVTKTQSVWEWQNVKGTLVGFRFPAYLSNVNLADYHFHFISDDKKRGGHLLDCQLQSGEIAVQPLRKFEMTLPTGNDFDDANLSTVENAELKQAEQGR
jgi:acetolactate decarboxylase